MKYEVQTAFIYGWENCWTIEHDDGTSGPQYFDTESKAQQAIDDLLKSVKEAVKRGDMIEHYHQSDFRIREVKS